jgi:hypothetical protein
MAVFDWINVHEGDRWGKTEEPAVVVEAEA